MRVKIQLNAFYVKQNQIEKGYNLLVSSIEELSAISRIIESIYFECVGNGLYELRSIWHRGFAENRFPKPIIRLSCPSIKRKSLKLRKQLGNWDEEQ